MPSAASFVADLAHARDAQRTLSFENRGQRRARRIEEVAEHVHVAAIVDRGDLDAGDDADVDALRHVGDLGNRRDRVVIGDADGGEAAAAARATSCAGESRPSDAVVCR